MHATTEIEPRDVVLLATRALVGVAARALMAVSADVSLPQYRVLVLLDSNGAQSMRTLAASLDVSPSTATRVCDRLADKRLILRRPDDQDRRAVRVQLSARGRKLVDEVKRLRRAQIEEILDRMGPAAEQRVARAFFEFAAAAGEAPDHAWALGWSNDSDAPADRSRRD